MATKKQTGPVQPRAREGEDPPNARVHGREHRHENVGKRKKADDGAGEYSPHETKDGDYPRHPLEGGGTGTRAV